MNMGVERANAQPQEGVNWTGEVDPPAVEESWNEAYEDDAPDSSGSKPLAIILILAGLAWLGAALWSLVQGGLPEGLAAWVAWTASTASPLALLALIWLIFGRQSRRETLRFLESVDRIRSESDRLDQQLAAVAQRLEGNRIALTEEAARLMTLGDEASDRLGRVTHYIARESTEMERKAQSLDDAASAARLDIGVLLADLPRAEEQARLVTTSLRDAGLAAHGQAASLEAQLAAVTARSREADEAIGGATQRLGAQVSRIESSTGAVVTRIDDAAMRMNNAVDSALSRASDSLTQTRGALDEQGRTMLALVEQGRSAFATAQEGAASQLTEQIEEARGRIDWLAGRIAEQELASQALAAGLSARIVDLVAQLDRLGSQGETETLRITSAVSELRVQAQALQTQLGESEGQSAKMIGSTRDMAAALAEMAGQLRDQLPPALDTVEQRTDAILAAAERAAAPLQAIQDSAALAETSVANSEAGLARQQAALEALVARLSEASRFAQAELDELQGSIRNTDDAATRLAGETAQHLVQALVRVREASSQAALHAREAIAAAIPESAALLAEASRKAVTGAVTEPMQDQVAEITAVAQRATAVARQASERLTRQLLVIGETAAAIEDRIGEEKGRREEKDAENLTRRVSLLIEALNSTAIDVGKLLSNEIADTAWASYMKGDRGVFTRRAVRLLDSGEAREVLRHYEEEPDFREQVNRYVHDFETMLRRVLADRDGATIGVTLLSSDMGKLYVALSQAIERSRRSGSGR